MRLYRLEYNRFPGKQRNWFLPGGRSAVRSASDGRPGRQRSAHRNERCGFPCFPNRRSAGKGFLPPDPMTGHPDAAQRCTGLHRGRLVPGQESPVRPAGRERKCAAYFSGPLKDPDPPGFQPGRLRDKPGFRKYNPVFRSADGYTRECRSSLSAFHPKRRRHRRWHPGAIPDSCCPTAGRTHPVRSRGR